MTRLRDLPDFETLWSRRTTIRGEGEEMFELMAVEDLVQAKKTQREKDWPVITALVEGHYKSLHQEPTPERIRFWIKESRTPERLADLIEHFPNETEGLLDERPLLRLVIEGKADELRSALDAEMRAVQAKDREYWAPLKAEIEEFRRQERLSRQ